MQAMSNPLFAMGSALTLVAFGCFCSITKGDRPAVPFQYYAKRVAVPEEITSVERLEFRDKNGEVRTVMILPPVLYLESHYMGWQRCLRQVMKTGEIRARTPKPGSDFQPYSHLGKKQGYIDCLEYLKKLKASGHTQAEIKDYCEKAYRPMPTRRPAPPEKLIPEDGQAEALEPKAD